MKEADHRGSETRLLVIGSRQDAIQSRQGSESLPRGAKMMDRVDGGRGS
jgi:hypothetical protein